MAPLCRWRVSGGQRRAQRSGRRGPGACELVLRVRIGHRLAGGVRPRTHYDVTMLAIMIYTIVLTDVYMMSVLVLLDVFNLLFGSLSGVSSMSA